MKYLTIRTYLLLLIFTMTAIPLAIIAYDTHRQYLRTIDQSYLNLERLAHDVESDQKAFHTSFEQLMAMLGAIPAVQHHDPQAANRLLAQTVGKSPLLTNMYLIDPSGDVWASAAPFTGTVSVAERRHFRNALKSGVFSSGEFVTGKLLKRPVLNFSYPLKDLTGKIYCIAAVSFAVSNYNDLLRSRHISPDTSLVLTDHQGTILYSSVGPEYSGRKDKLFPHMLDSANRGRFEAIGNSGTRRIHFYKPVRLSTEPTPYLFIRTGMANRTLIDTFNLGLLKNSGLLLLLLIAASGLTLYLSRTMVLNKIDDLRQAMQRVAEGDLTVRVSDYVSGGELGALGSAFDRMTERLNIDISERVRAEEQAIRSEERLRVIFEASQAGIIVVDPTGIITFANRRMAEMFDWPLEQLIGSPYPDHLHPDEKQTGDIRMRQLISGEISYVETERHYQRRDGTDFWGYLSGRRHETADGTLQALIGIIADITDRKQAEDQLKQSEEKFAAIFNSSPDSININRLDDSVFVDINDGFTQMLGYTRGDVIGNPSKDMGIWTDTEDRDRLAQQLRSTGNARNFEAKLCRKDGAVITALISSTLIEVNGTPCTLNIARDITERDQILAELGKIHKLESLGVLAGGIAHDFNNILTGIMGNISFAKMKVNDPVRTRELLDNAEKASQRASDLAKQLLVFAKGGKPVKKPLSLRAAVDDALSLTLTGTNVKGVVNLPESLHLVEADEGQLNQAFHNIVINATQAMPGGGTLSVSGDNCELADGNHLSLPAGTYVALAFNDQGCGISEEDLKRIFDPYFSTKAGGSGLGLASTYAIIKNHGGQITVTSTIGAGSTFTIYLPSIGLAQPGTTAAEEAASIAPGCGAVLVMDDEELIRDLTTDMLTHYGYSVTTCIDGNDAVALYTAAHQAGSPYTAVLIDLTIPGGMGGEEAARHILAADPLARLIVSSGYADNPVMGSYRDYGFVAAIEKPYTVDQLGEVLARVTASKPQ